MPPLDEKDYYMDVEITACVDWLSTTAHSKTTTIEDRVYPKMWPKVYEPLERGMMGYTMGKRYADGRLELVNPSRPEMGVHLVYSGATLAQLVDAGYVLNAWKVVEWHKNLNHKPTRIDLALDARGYGLSVKELADLFDKGDVVTNTGRGLFYAGLRDTGDTLYVGANTSKKRMRIYDKAKERGQSGDWKRLELQLRGDYAVKAVDMIQASEKKADTIAALIRGYCDFPSSRAYSMIVGFTGLEMKSPDKPESNTDRWILEQVVPGLAKYFTQDLGHVRYDDFIQILNDAIVERSTKQTQRTQ